MIYFVHGFNHDPDDPKHSPYTTLYPIWEKGLQADDTTWFGWYSAPSTISARLRALRDLPWRQKPLLLHSRYYYAWMLSRGAGDRLARLIDDGPPATIICHSLGSRVALCALEKTTAEKVLILNGADECEHALKVARACKKTTFYNVVVAADQVVRVLGQQGSPTLGHADCIGAKGLPNGPANWIDIPLDDPEFKDRAKAFGYKLRGNNPDEIADHSESYEHEPNWVLWRDILNDKCLMPL